MTLVDRLRDPDHKYLTSDDDDYADLHHAAANRIAALQEALRDVLDCVWSGSSADRKFWRDEAVATFERAAALAQADTAHTKWSDIKAARHNTAEDDGRIAG